MKFKVFLIMVMSFIMIDPAAGLDRPNPRENKYLRLEVLSGIEAEIIRVAVERFHAEKFKVNPHHYDISIYLNNDDYVIFFETAKNVLPGTIFFTYEVVISSKTLKVTHAQFSR